ncbi:HP0495 family protein [Desulfomarina sp.]
MKTPCKEPRRPEIEYPCSWVYKVIGQDCSLLKDAIIDACGSLSVTISHSHSSSGGKYHSLNAELTVHSEETRLAIYESLKASPVVKLVL